MLSALAFTRFARAQSLQETEAQDAALGQDSGAVFSFSEVEPADAFAVVQAEV